MPKIKKGDVFESSKYGSVEVIKYNGYHDVVIKFHNTGFIRSIDGGALRKGTIIDYSIDPKRCDISNRRLRNEFEGKVFTSVTDGDFKVIQYNSCTDVVIEFLSTGTLLTTHSSQVKNGSIRDPYRISVGGVGYLGVGKYNCINNKIIHNTWMHMLDRCYNEKSPNYPIYGSKGITVCKEWYNFQNFAAWYDINTPKKEEVRYHIDKDFNGEGIYSPQNCVLIPDKLNIVLAMFRPVHKVFRSVKEKGYYSAYTLDEVLYRTNYYPTEKEAREESNTAKIKYIEDLLNSYVDDTIISGHSERLIRSWIDRNRDKWCNSRK